MSSPRKSFSLNGPVGRFQAIKFDSHDIFIIDTKEGHLWTWGTSTETGSVLIYEGRVMPGYASGDIIKITPEPKNEKSEIIMRTPGQAK